MYTFSIRLSGYHMLNFIAIHLQLYKIFQIMRVSFFGTHCKTRGQSNLTKSASRGAHSRLGVTPGGRNLYH